MEVPSKEELFKELVKIIFNRGVNLFEYGDKLISCSEPAYIYCYLYDRYKFELVGGSWNQMIRITNIIESHEDSLSITFEQNTWGDPAKITNEKENTLIDLYSLILKIKK